MSSLVPYLVAIGVAVSVGLLITAVWMWADRRWLAEERTLRARLVELSRSEGRAVEESIMHAELDRSGLMGAWRSVERVLASWPLPDFLSRRAKRALRVERQLPDAVEMLANALRAGYSLPASIGFVGSELPEPLGPEFVRFHDEQRLGIDTRQALGNLERRIGSLDGRLLVLAITVQRETGGNLAEVLSRIADVIRQRIAFREQVSVLTSEARASAKILAVLPIGLFCILLVVSPSYAGELTGSTSGRAMLGYGAASLAVGFVWLRKLSRIEV
jgi:tight adherence protein B